MLHFVDLAHPGLTEFSPRLEFALQQSATSDGFQGLLREAVKCLHTALVNRMEKEPGQVHFFKELHVLNTHLSHSLADYPSLNLHTILGAQEGRQHLGT